MQAARRGRGSAGQGYGRPLPYAGSGLITDVQVQATLTDAQVASLFNVTILAKGRVNIGYAGAPNTLAIGYIWNNRTKRWSYLDYSFIDAATDPAAQLYLQRDVIGRALAPADVLLDVFEELESRPEEAALRYLVALQLVRRRVLRIIDSSAAESGSEVLVLACRKRHSEYRVAVVAAEEAAAEGIEERLHTLLWSGGEA